jgi:uncharacterized protein YndB with AHSA1/START domain
MNTSTPLAPVVKSVETSRGVDDAFALFTRGIARWWPRHRHSVSQDRCTDVVLEPRVGGSLHEVRDDGETFAWGRVLAWDPPHRLVVSWHPGYEEARSTEVEVRFEPIAGGTRVTLEHRNWERLGADADATRGGYDQGWVGVLELYEKALRAS